MKKKRKVKKIMQIGIGVVVVITGVVAGVLFVQNQKPQIVIEPPKGKFEEIPNKPNCVSTQTNQLDKKIDVLVFKGDIDRTKELVKKALQEYGGIEVNNEETNYIYAVATTGTMKFHDDIEIYFDVEKGIIHYRSASRAGYSDRGLNKERFDKIKTLYEAY